MAIDHAIVNELLNSYGVDLVCYTTVLSVLGRLVSVLDLSVLDFVDYKLLIIIIIFLIIILKKSAVNLCF